MRRSKSIFPLVDELYLLILIFVLYHEDICGIWEMERPVLIYL